MDIEENIFPDGWKKKRKQTMVIFFLSFFIQGLEFTTIFSTLWWYVNKDIRNTNPDTFYGLIASGRFVF